MTPAIDLTAGDPLDAQIGHAAGVPASTRWRRMHRAALGLSATRVPLFLMLAAGALLGPRGAAVLSPARGVAAHSGTSAASAPTTFCSHARSLWSLGSRRSRRIAHDDSAWRPPTATSGPTTA